MDVSVDWIKIRYDSVKCQAMVNMITMTTINFRFNVRHEHLRYGLV